MDSFSESNSPRSGKFDSDRDALEEHPHFDQELNVVLDIWFDGKAHEYDYHFAYPWDLRMTIDDDDDVVEFVSDNQKPLEYLRSKFRNFAVNWYPNDVFEILDLIRVVVFELRLTYIYHERDALTVSPDSDWNALTATQKAQLGLAGLLYLHKDLLVALATATPRMLLSLAPVNRVFATLARNDHVWEYMFRRDFPEECDFYGGRIPFIYERNEEVYALRPKFMVKWDAIDGPMPWKRWYTHSTGNLYVISKEAILKQRDAVMEEWFSATDAGAEWDTPTHFESFLAAESQKLFWTCGKAFASTPDITKRQPIVDAIRAQYNHYEYLLTHSTTFSELHAVDYDMSRVKECMLLATGKFASVNDYVTRVMDNYDFSIKKDIMLAMGTFEWFMQIDQDKERIRRKAVRQFLTETVKQIMYKSVCKRDFSEDDANPLLIKSPLQIPTAAKRLE